MSAKEMQTLKLEIFVSEPEEINLSSALIIGPTEMMVVCAQTTKSAANRLADLIDQHARKLKYIFLTHPHFDHHLGAGILKERFPEARFIASPEVGRLQRIRRTYDENFAQQSLGDNTPTPSIPVEDYDADTILIDGETVEIWKNITGDAGFGYPDEPHVALYIPTLNAFLPSDVVFFDAHVFLGGSSVESRKTWIKQLDDWMACDFDVVVPGHLPKSSLTQLTPVSALDHTKAYIIAYDKAIAQVKSSDALIAKMIELYPNIKHQQGIFLSAFFDFFEFRSIEFDENGKPYAGPGPETSEAAEAQKAQFLALRQAYNHESE